MSEMLDKIYQFLDDLDRRGYSRMTIKAYRWDLKQFHRAAGPLPPSGVWSLKEYEDYARAVPGAKDKDGKPWSHLSVKRHLTAVRSFLRYWSTEAENPIEKKLQEKLGVPEKKEPPKLSELALQLASETDHCLQLLATKGYAERTRDTYGKLLSGFYKWVSLQKDLKGLADITTQRLQDYLFELSSRAGRDQNGLSLSTLGTHVSALSSLFDSLFKKGLLLVNPVYGLDRPKKYRTLPRDVLSFQEILRIFSLIDTGSAKELRNRAALELLYSCGLRRAELERLNLSSVYFQKRLLLVQGKGGKERLVPVGGEALRCLRRYLESARPTLNTKGSEALFLSSRGSRLRSASLLLSFKRYAKQARITKNVTLHGLRHSCATHMLAGGADIRHIQVFLGHSCLSSTQLYTRVEISDLQSMLDRYHPRDHF